MSTRSRPLHAPRGAGGPPARGAVSAPRLTFRIVEANGQIRLLEVERGRVVTRPQRWAERFVGRPWREVRRELEAAGATVEEVDEE